MLYMLVERFKPGAAPEIYRGLRTNGRRLPDGLDYVASWVDLELTTCWQLLKTDDRALLEAWCEGGRDLVDLEIVPVGRGTGDDGRTRRRADTVSQVGPGWIVGGGCGQRHEISAAGSRLTDEGLVYRCLCRRVVEAARQPG